MLRATGLSTALGSVVKLSRPPSATCFLTGSRSQTLDTIGKPRRSANAPSCFAQATSGSSHAFGSWATLSHGSAGPSGR